MGTVSIFGVKMVLKQLRAPRFKKAYTCATPPPWSKLRSYLAGRSAAQVKVNDSFKRATKATAGLALADRMEIIGDAMRGASFGGVKRVIYARLAPEALKAKKQEVAALIRGA